MTTTCAECGKTVSLREERRAERVEKQVRRNYRKSLTFSLLGGGVATPALFMIFNYISSGQILFLFYGSLILLSSIATLAVNARDVSLPLKRADL